MDKIQQNIVPSITNFKNLKQTKDITKIFSGIDIREAFMVIKSNQHFGREAEKPKSENWLGKGAFGAVYKATRIATGSIYAVKVVNKNSANA